ncbi:hypothetical protein N473_21805 [Pseudoalteromonas luteoviolacea CPMOR-1]|uniref:HTH araC/xylS-type domain-containing protein n=1 Tax=Pseudoalteromonas luteoviolacea CPMOR-1 TaxID=1365248 RepID=A0A162C442_9GAMM|nr:helix-turn-helix domain-containing protein [Pseudoalteromonas luteoviolacea]KZN61826.1 hypothetical protein N473_21805 [Pseudoalteromonas luteoviolacea CPMOR-1]
MLELNYHPVQGIVTSTKQYQTLQAPYPLCRWVDQFWQIHTPLGQFAFHSVPDNCVDWIINLSSFADNTLIAPFTSANTFEFEGPAQFFGIRFNLLGHTSLCKAPLGDWAAYSAIDAADLLPLDLVENTFEILQSNIHFSSRCKALSHLLLQEVKLPKLDPRLINFIRFSQSHLNTQMSLSDKQCSEFGISARQLRRLTSTHLGLSPKSFTQVLRFQHALKALLITPETPAWQESYFDQAHFIKDFKRFAGVTPQKFRNLSVLYNKNKTT